MILAGCQCVYNFH